MSETNPELAQVAAKAAKDRRTRRRLLAGAAGALGVAATGVVGRAAPAQAIDVNFVAQGVNNGPTSARTAVFTNGNKEVGALADPDTSGKGSLGVYGLGQDSGVLGIGGTGSGTGVTWAGRCTCVMITCVTRQPPVQVSHAG